MGTDTFLTQTLNRAALLMQTLLTNAQRTQCNKSTSHLHLADRLIQSWTNKVNLLQTQLKVFAMIILLLCILCTLKYNTNS